MRGANVSPVKRGRGTYAFFTEGDEGEQLIANVLLAAMVSQLSSEAAAAGYVERAHALAEGLARRSVTYRSLRPSKFARLSFEVAGQIETGLVSVINDALVVPAFSSDKLKTNLLRTRAEIKFVDIELVQFVLRLRTRRIVAALEAMRTATSLATLLQTVKYFLTECLRQEVRSVEPLDRANDCFTLAHDLVGKRNYPLAALLINNAADALDTFLKSTHVQGHHAVAYSMKGEIGRLLKQIKQAAA